MSRPIYIISNSHLDPVWIWSRSNGRCSWLNTMHSVVRVMRDYPEVKFTCSAAALYRWLEQTAPLLFEEIRSLVKAGRWEIVGGWEVQSDVIISRAETLRRQAQLAKSYFRDKFDVDVDIAYCVDSFGHGAGLPAILKETGFTRYAFSRGDNLPQLFDWSGDADECIRCLRIPEGYCTSGLDRSKMLKRLERVGQLDDSPVAAMFFGIGDHGGGLSRSHLDALREVKASGQYDIRFATLKEFFDDTADFKCPEIKGEIGGIFRGCYSACHDIKRHVARATQRLMTAERLGVPAAELEEPWRELCFNHFHDILPGTSIRSAQELDIMPGIGSVEHRADFLIDRELARRSENADTSFMAEGGMQLWNPSSEAVTAVADITGFADPNEVGRPFNALATASGEEFPLQLMQPETTFGPCGVAWGRLVAAIPLASKEERYLAYCRSDRDFGKVGFSRQRTVQERIAFPVYVDGTRTWGFGLVRFKDCLGQAECLSVTECVDGPVCSVLRSQWRYHDSTIQLDLTAFRGIDEFLLEVKMDWHETNCALKLALKNVLEKPNFITGNEPVMVTRYDAAAPHWNASEWRDGRLEPMAAVTAEVPMIDWCALRAGGKLAAFYAADLHSCDYADGAMRITINRPVLFSDHEPFPSNTQTGWADLGYGTRTLWLLESDAVNLDELPAMARRRLDNAECREVTLK